MPARHLILLAAALAATATVDARRWAPKEATDRKPEPTLAVVVAGNEPALQYGPTILPRPFGGELIDTLSIAGRYRIGADTLFLVRGSGGKTCPSRYIIVSPSHGGAPKLSAPFGTCALADAGLAGPQLVVTMPASAAGGPPVRYAFQGGNIVPIDGEPLRVTGTPDTACRRYEQVGPAGRDAVMAEFDRNFPDDYRHDSRIAKASLSDDDLRRLVTGLACLATWPGAEHMVPEAATPLFASKRYGAASFAALRTVARTPGIDVGVAAAVRSFGAEMRYYVDRRTAL